MSEETELTRQWFGQWHLLRPGIGGRQTWWRQWRSHDTSGRVTDLGIHYVYPTA